MKQNKFIVMFYFLLIASLVQYFANLNVYLMIICMIVAFTILWYYLEKQEMHVKLRENIELQEEVKSTAKDAHLKNKQLLTIAGSIPFPLLLIDQFGNIVMHNNISDVSLDISFDTEMSYINNNLVSSARDFVKDAFILEKQLDKIIKINQIEYQAISVPVMAKGKYSGCLVLFQDISKTLEGEKMQKRFIADASHELKTPISVIKGMVEILNRDDFDDEQTQKEFLTQIDVEINRLDLLVKDLLQLSRLSMSNPILERKKTNLTSIIDRAVTSLEQKAEQKGLVIVKDYQNSEEVFCDPMRMQQVVLNLLSNAIKYSDQGTITLTTAKDDHHYILIVKDEGCGLKASDIEKIFDRFYRVNDDRSRQSGGSGLGLAITKGIIDAHSGTIEVESEPGKGTTFIVKLKN